MTSSRFLEFGIGTGRMALPFVQAGCDYTGIDLSRPMMEVLRRKVETVPARVAPVPGLVQGDITRLPFADGSFDVVIVVHVLHLVAEWREALVEAQRVLRKSGGWLLSDEVHAEAARRLSAWLDHECPNPDAEISGNAQFRATVARW